MDAIRHRLGGNLGSVPQLPFVGLDSRPTFPRIAATERTPFVGRQAERHQLQRLLDKAGRRCGGVVLVGGEAGVGKTRLTEELADEARRLGILTLPGRCSDMEGAPPYISFVEILEALIAVLPAQALREALGQEVAEVARLMPRLRRIFPDIPEALRLPPEQERRHLFNSIREFLERTSRCRPLLLVVEDLQWADEPTLFLLEHLCHRVSELAILVVGTFRDVELEASSSLARVVEALSRLHLTRLIALKRLPRDDVATMLEALAGERPPGPFTDFFYAGTEGNPFFVEEVFRHLAEEGKLLNSEGRLRTNIESSELVVPDTVRLVLRRRLGRLSQQTQRVLAIAAVVGRQFTFELLQSLEMVEPAALLETVDEAHRAGLLVSTPSKENQLGFAHELVRQTLLADVSRPRRRQLNAAVAAAMERMYAAEPEEHASELAHHLLEAERPADAGKAIRYLTLAADRAMKAAAYEDALGNLVHALPLASPSDRRARADLHARVGFAQRSMGRLEEAVTAWRQALDAYEALGEAEQVGRIAVEASFGFGWIGRWEMALEMAKRGLLALGERAGPDRARLLAFSGLMVSWGGSFEQGAQMIDEAIELGERLGDDAVLGFGLQMKAMHHYAFGQARRTVDTGLRGIDLLRSAGAQWDQVELMAWVQYALTLMGRFREAETNDWELEPFARRLGHAGALLLARRERAGRDFCRSGDLDGLERFALSDLDLCRRTGMPWTSHTYLLLGMVELWRGRWDQAAEHFEESHRLDVPTPWAGWGPAHLLLCRAYQGERDQVLAMFRELRHRLLPAGGPKSCGAWETLVCAVEGLAMVGERDKAAELYPLVLEALEEGLVLAAFHIRLIHKIAAIAAAAGGRWDEAEEHYRTAMRQAEELPHLTERAEVRHHWAQMCIDRDGPGDRERARGLLEEAVLGYRQVGMPKHEKIAAALLLTARRATQPRDRADVFRKEGDYWTIVHEGHRFHLRDTKGLRYLAVLLGNPGREIAATDLAGGAEGAAGPRKVSVREAAEAGLSFPGLGDAGEVIDERAKTAYRRRLAELRRELEEAEAWADPERAARTREEIDALTAELARAVGLGGKARRAGSPAERARVNVTRAIKAAISHIREQSPALCHYLERTVCTGTFCAYLPDPRDPSLLDALS